MVRPCIAVTTALLATASGQIIFGPGTSSGGQQLVQDCGKAQPSGIFFPSSSPISPLRRNARPQFVSPSGGPRLQRSTVVVGGKPVQLEGGKWPWMVLLGEQRDGRRRWTCGGTLISAGTVLTAAHCVAGRQPSDLTARLGEHDTSSTRDGQHVDVAVSRIIVHPNYLKKQNDIALLQLSTSVPFNRRVQPACLPPANSDHAGKTADLAGWGYTEFNGEVPRVLQEVKLKVVGERQCEDAYRTLPAYQSVFPGGFQGTKLCANGADGASKDACSGDSGGPLVYQTEGTDRRYQVTGVVSTGLGCGNPQFPGIYTKVSKYIPWIINNSV